MAKMEATGTILHRGWDIPTRWGIDSSGTCWMSGAHGGVLKEVSSQTLMANLSREGADYAAEMERVKDTLRQCAGRGAHRKEDRVKVEKQMTGDQTKISPAEIKAARSDLKNRGFILSDRFDRQRNSTYEVWVKPQEGSQAELAILIIISLFGKPTLLYKLEEK